MQTENSGFTLIELMIVIVVIAILAAIAIPQYNNLLTKSREGATKGNLSGLRSALSIYFGDNEQTFPSDNLTSLAAGTRYIPFIPTVKTPGYHPDSSSVVTEVSPTDTGQWSYDNDSTTPLWGTVVVGCKHNDYYGNTWTTF